MAAESDYLDNLIDIGSASTAIGSSRKNSKSSISEAGLSIDSLTSVNSDDDSASADIITQLMDAVRPQKKFDEVWDEASSKCDSSVDNSIKMSVFAIATSYSGQESTNSSKSGRPAKAGKPARSGGNAAQPAASVRSNRSSTPQSSVRSGDTSANASAGSGRHESMISSPLGSVLYPSAVPVRASRSTRSPFVGVGSERVMPSSYSAGQTEDGGFFQSIGEHPNVMREDEVLKNLTETMDPRDNICEARQTDNDRIREAEGKISESLEQDEIEKKEATEAQMKSDEPIEEHFAEQQEQNKKQVITKLATREMPEDNEPTEDGGIPTEKETRKQEAPASGHISKSKPTLLSKLKARKNSKRSKRFFGKKSRDSSAHALPEEDKVVSVQINELQNESEEPESECGYGSVHSMPRMPPAKNSDKTKVATYKKMPRVESNCTNGTENITTESLLNNTMTEDELDDAPLNAITEKSFIDNLMGYDVNTQEKSSPNEAVGTGGFLENIFTCGVSTFGCDVGGNSSAPSQSVIAVRKASVEVYEDYVDEALNVECTEDDMNAVRIDIYGPEPRKQEGVNSDSVDHTDGMEVTSKIIMRTHVMPGFEVSGDDKVVDSVSMKIDDIAQKLEVRRQDKNVTGNKIGIRKKLMQKLKKGKSTASKPTMLSASGHVAAATNTSNHAEGKKNHGIRRRRKKGLMDQLEITCEIEDAPAKISAGRDQKRQQAEGGLEETDNVCSKIACGSGGGSSLAEDDEGDLDIPCGV